MLDFYFKWNQKHLMSSEVWIISWEKQLMQKPTNLDNLVNLKMLFKTYGYFTSKFESNTYRTCLS